MVKIMLPLLVSTTLLSACATAGAPVQMATIPNQAQLQAQSRLRNTERITINTAKNLFLEAEPLAMKWSPTARLAHVEGVNIALSGKNEFPIDAYWAFSFVDPEHPGKAFRIEFRSQHTQAVSFELPVSKLAHQEPLEERAWGFDSNKALNAARKQTEMLMLPSPRMELIGMDGRLVWRMPAIAPMPPVLLDAMNGQPFVMYRR